MGRTYGRIRKEDFEVSLRAVLSKLFIEQDGIVDSNKISSVKKLFREDPLAELLDRVYLDDLGNEDDWNVDFSLEGVICKSQGSDYIGVQQIGDLVFLGCVVGGVWEDAIFFILYFELPTVMGVYIPKRGNTYCSEHMAAWGSCDISDGEEFVRHYDSRPKVKFNWDEIRKDITESFDIR